MKYTTNQTNTRIKRKKKREKEMKVKVPFLQQNIFIKQVMCIHFHMRMAYRRLSRTMRWVTSDVCGSSADTQTPSGPFIRGCDMHESSDNGARRMPQKKETPSSQREGDLVSTAATATATARFSSATREVLFLEMKRILLMAASNLSIARLSLGLIEEQYSS